MKKRGKILNWFSRLTTKKESNPSSTLTNKIMGTKEETKKKVSLFSLDEEKGKRVNQVDNESIRHLPIKPIKYGIENNHDTTPTLKEKKEIKKETIVNPIKKQDEDKTKVIEKKQIEKQKTPIKDESILPPTINIEENQEGKISKDKKPSTTLPYEDYLKNSILDELDKMLKTSYYEIKKIQYDLEQLEKEEDETLIRREIDAIIYKLQQLMQRFETIKKEFLRKNPNTLSSDLKEDVYIKELIEEYKFLSNNGSISNANILQVKQIREYTHIIDEIIDIQNRCSKLNDNLDEKKNKDVNRDKYFDDFANNKELDEIHAYITSFNNTQEQIIKQLESKIAESDKVTKTVTYKTELVVNYSKLLKATLLMAVSPIIPPTRGGNLLKIGLMAGAITNLSSFIRTSTKEDKTIVKTVYTDYEKDIRKSIDNVDEMAVAISKTLTDIKYLKKTFDKEFGEYAELIPEYYSMLTKLNDIEKDLQVKEALTKEYNNRLDKALEKNNIKVKRIEED